MNGNPPDLFVRSGGVLLELNQATTDYFGFTTDFNGFTIDLVRFTTDFRSFTTDFSAFTTDYRFITDSSNLQKRFARRN